MVTSVALVTGLLDYVSKQRDERVQMRGHYGRLQETDRTSRTEIMEPGNRLEGSTLSYARDGQAHVGQKMQREYTY